MRSGAVRGGGTGKLCPVNSISPKERFLGALSRRPQDRPPGWMMRQAGRYLPEYQALRSGRSFMECVRNPEIAAEITMQPIRRFGMDAAVIFSDILVPPAAMGIGVEFHEGRGPLLDPVVRDEAALERLADFDAERDTGFLAQALRRVRAELGEERALIGFCGAPFTTVSYMIEGGSSRSFERTKELLHGRPDFFDALMARVTAQLGPYLAMQVAAGADALQIFDSWGGALDRETYAARVAPSLRRLVVEAKATGVPVVLYVNGGGHLLDVLLACGPDALSIDWRVDAAEARRATLGRAALQGNLDPCILFAPEDVVRRETRRVLERFADHPGYVFNLGSGILPKTPPQNVAAAFETLHAWPG